MLPAAEVHRGQSEQRRLADRVKRKREQRADQRHESRARRLTEAAQPTALDPDRAHDLCRVGAQHRVNVQQAQRGEHDDRDDDPEGFHPLRDLPLPRQRADDQGDGDHDRAMTEREERAAEPRQAWLGMHVEACQAIDGGEMVGIEAVLEPQQEHEKTQGRPILRQGIHRLLPMRGTGPQQAAHQGYFAFCV